MIKSKDKNKKKIISKSLAILSLSVLSLSLFSIKANALGSLPVGSSGGSKLDAVSVPTNGFILRKQFNNLGQTQKNWYQSGGRTNLVFYSSYKGFTFYSPVPLPADAPYSTNRSYGQMYENANKTTSVPASWTLVDKSYPNLKKYSAPANDVSLNNLSQGMGITNTYAPYKGVNGEWRYLGYSSFGNEIVNPYFPSDNSVNYTTGNYPYDTNPWVSSLACPGGKSIWDYTTDNITYEQKLDAIYQLLQQQPTMRAKSTDLNYWANRLSLRTDPIVTSAVFVGTRNNHNQYRAVSVISKANNLRVTSEVVKDKATGAIIGSYTRNSTDPNNFNPTTYVADKLKVGNEYTVTVQVKNMSDKATITNPSVIDVGTGTGSAYNSNTLDFSDNQYKANVTLNSVYSAGETKTFTWDLAIPEDAGSGMRVTALIDQIHNENGDNTDPNDDTANIPFQITGGGGNFGIKSIKLVDKNGVEQDKATPGEDYKIRYYVHYTGEDVKIPIYRTEYYSYTGADGQSHTSSYTVFDHWYYPVEYLPLYSTIYRNIPPVYSYADVRSTTIDDYDTVVNGKTYIYTTSTYQTYEVPVIKTTASLSSYMTSIEKDPTSANPSDNSLSAEWHEIYDLSVNNVKVLPITETPYTAGYQTFAVQFDINSKAPSWLNTYEKDASVVVALGNQTTPIKVHLTKGSNTLITQEMKVWVDPKAQKQLTATVTMNYDKMTWEEDVLSPKNDQASAVANIVPPYDPHNGAPVQNTTNSWTENYNIHNWTGVHKVYTDVGGRTHSFNQYSSVGNNPQSKAQNESYKITSIKFRSKLTTDTQQGANKDGWVELTNPGVVGMIKAGYGYELKISVNYNTNAFIQPTFNVYGTYMENGNWVRPYNVTPNLPDQLFVRTPDGQILSVDGYSNTNAGLDYSKSGDMKTNETWVYTIKSKDTLGIKSVPKIFIDENTKDGVYNLQVFTPMINGVPTKTSGSPLCDSKTVQIKIQGSDTDDLKSHITQ